MELIMRVCDLCEKKDGVVEVFAPKMDPKFPPTAGVAMSYWSVDLCAIHLKDFYALVEAQRDAMGSLLKLTERWAKANAGKAGDWS